MSRRVSFASLALACGALSLGYYQAGMLVMAASIIGAGLVWLAGQWRWVRGVAALGLIATAALAAHGLIQGAGGAWMLGAMIAALTTWDLDRLARAMERVGRVENGYELERRHLQRLLVVDGVGFILGALALQLQLRLGFGVAVILGFLVAWGLSRTISFFRQASN